MLLSSPLIIPTLRTSKVQIPRISAVPSIATATTTPAWRNVHTITNLNLQDGTLDDDDISILVETICAFSPDSLTCILLNSNHIGDYGARLLFNMATMASSLVELDLSSNRLTDESIMAIPMLSRSTCSLRVLKLNGNHIGDVGMCHLCVAVVPILDVLHITNNDIGDVGAKSMAQAVMMTSHLQYLFMVTGNEMITRGEGGKALAIAWGLSASPLFDHDIDISLVNFDVLQSAKLSIAVKPSKNPASWQPRLDWYSGKGLGHSSPAFHAWIQCWQDDFNRDADILLDVPTWLLAKSNAEQVRAWYNGAKSVLCLLAGLYRGHNNNNMINWLSTSGDNALLVRVFSLLSG